jgi:membrane dipeptidase
MTNRPDVRQLHEDATVIDARDPTFLTYRQIGESKDAYWQVLSDGGVTASVVDVPWTEDGLREACINFASWRERIDRRTDSVLIQSTSDIERTKNEGRHGFILSSQTPTIIEDEPALLRTFHDLGLRVMQLAYQRRNLIADSCGERADGGLSRLGVRVVREMNRLGIAIDLSHASDRTVIEAINESSEPVFFSHSNARSVVNHPRNVPDEYLLKLAERGGICCVSAYSAFLRAGGGETGTTLEDYVAMVDYIVGLIGVDHVGMGFDVGEFRTDAEVALIGGGVPGGGHAKETRYVGELSSRANLIALTEALVARGYADADVKRFLGGNLIAFFAQVWPGAE